MYPLPGYASGMSLHVLHLDFFFRCFFLHTFYNKLECITISSIILGGNTVDGWNLANHLGWCWNPINNGINYLSLNWFSRRISIKLLGLQGAASQCGLCTGTHHLVGCSLQEKVVEIGAKAACWVNFLVAIQGLQMVFLLSTSFFHRVLCLTLRWLGQKEGLAIWVFPKIGVSPNHSF